jgi:transcriptional regulator with XRE-family HTH domain
MKPTISKPARDAALALIKTAMIEKKLTQAELADASDCHEKTIQNLLGGRSVRDQTLFDVCMVLGLDFDKVKGGWDGARETPKELSGDGGMVAPVYMGAYTRAGVDHYLGSYLTVRPALSHTGSIVAYRTDITWDPDWPSLLFQERNRPDAPYSHRGRLYIPASSMFIHLVSLTKGAMRMIVVSQIDRFGEMRGLITTLHKQGAMLVPVATPIVYAKRDDIDGPFGEIAEDNPAHAGYRKILVDTVADGYARLVKP